jgi:hypothetical protein
MTTLTMPPIVYDDAQSYQNVGQAPRCSTACRLDS